MKPDPKADEKEIKWGYAFAGVLAIGIAAVVQFAFGELAQDVQENLPAVIAIPYALGGKLGLTIPLAVIGLCLILRDTLVRGGGSKPTKTSSRPSKPVAQQEEEELEMGEPITEMAEDEPKPGVTKIPAARRRFGGARPSGSATGGSTDGQVVLASAKYLNTNAGKPDFRKGKSVSTNTE